MIYITSLRSLRHKHKLTLEELSKISGVSRSDLSRIERGETDMRMTTAVLLAKSLKCSLDDLVKFDK